LHRQHNTGLGFGGRGAVFGNPCYTSYKYLLLMARHKYPVIAVEHLKGNRRETDRFQMKDSVSIIALGIYSQGQLLTFKHDLSHKGTCFEKFKIL
jgi:hypothetical protein